MSMEKEVITVENMQNNIFTIRGLQVKIDRDLAKLYDVETKVLNQAVKRNIDRFPSDFMFQLSQEEFNNWRSQFVTSNKNTLRSQSVTIENGRGKHRKYLPFVFTEQGVSMLSSVLRSETAIAISVKIIRAFVQMRNFIASNAGIFQRLDKVEQKQPITDTKIDKILNAIEEKDREIILQSLFSRADTGLLKGDSSPTMPDGLLNQIVKNFGG